MSDRAECEPDWKKASWNPKTTCKNEQIKGGKELFSRTGSCDLRYVKFISEKQRWCSYCFPHSTIKPTFWCRQTKRRARRPIAAFTFLNETGFIHPGLGLKYYSAMRIKRVYAPQVLLQCEIHLSWFFSDIMIISRFLCVRIFRLDGVFMNCLVSQQRSGWWVGGVWRSCIIHEEGGQSFSSLTERNSVTGVYQMLQGCWPDIWRIQILLADLQTLGIILQRNYRDFGEEKCRNERN